MIPERVWQWYWPTNAKGMSGINVIAHEWGNHCSTVYEFFKTQGLIPKSVSISLLYDNRKLDHFLVRLLQNSAHLTILIDGTERLQFSHLHLFLNLIEKKLSLFIRKFHTNIRDICRNRNRFVFRQAKQSWILLFWYFFDLLILH